MNIFSPKGVLTTEMPESGQSMPSRPGMGAGGMGVSVLSGLSRAVVSKTMTFVLAAAALCVSLSTCIILARGSPLGVGSELGTTLALTNVSVLLLLGAVLAGRLTRVWAERRRGSAGSQLHVRLVLLFSGVAVAPTIVVACFAVAFFQLGIQAWFNEPVRTALSESLQVSRGYLEEHRNTIRSDALEMANDLTSAGQYLSADPAVFVNVLDNQTTLRGLTEAVIYEPNTGQILAAAGLFVGFGVEPPPPDVSRQALEGDVVVMNGGDGTRVRAVARLNATPPLLLMIGRPVDPKILGYMSRTEQAVSEYQRLDESRSRLQIAFAWIFTVVALLVLLAAALIGLVMANQIARPIGTLINAAERVRGGDLAVRVTEGRTRDELAGLSRAFNRMTGQLAAQRAELMEAYSQIDGRRRFTETVLAGVSAGVIGLDTRGRIELPNRAAAELLTVDLLAAIGRDLEEVAPEFAALIEAARAAPERTLTEEVKIGPPGKPRTLLVRIGAEMTAGRVNGFVVTFDDITELQLAQRKAAWADVARRIAHEIKNPLTPIQLAAERLKRRFTKEIKSDPETFGLCADTIIRHVGDIGRMVDEFSAFARMPQPVIRPEDLGLIARETLVLQRTALPGIMWSSDIPARGPVVACDKRMMRQAIGNLLRNAADAVAMRPGGSGPKGGGPSMGAPDADGPDAGGPGAGGPGAGGPGAGGPDASAPELGRPERGRTEVTRPEGGRTEVALTEAGSTEAGRREVDRPEMGSIEAAGSEPSGPIPAGAISVSVVDSNGLVSVRVTDNGVGLPREDRARLTEPYVTHKPKGTGLGLAIVKKIMEDHGGQVTLDDRPDGPGTVAALILPSTVEPDRTIPPATAPTENRTETRAASERGSPHRDSRAASAGLPRGATRPAPMTVSHGISHAL
jgi:two-component system nitrogen regulation sensor histidine kinase NtrY